MGSKDIILYGPTYAAVLVGLTVLALRFRRARLSAALAALGLIGLAVRAVLIRYAVEPLFVWLGSRIADVDAVHSIVWGGDHVLIAACALLLVASVVTGRDNPSEQE